MRRLIKRRARITTDKGEDKLRHAKLPAWIETGIFSWTPGNSIRVRTYSTSLGI